MSAKRTVTVMFRDDAPVIYASAAPAYRTARFVLTDEQAQIVTPIGKSECVERLILEPEAT